MTLLDECPEAGQFMMEVTENVERYKRFPSERFAKLVIAVMATNAVDRQNEVIDPGCLEDMAAQINRDSLWLTVEHNPLMAPIGRALAARRFYARESGIYFVAGVLGVYDCEKLPSFSDIGIDTAAATPDDVQGIDQAEQIPTAQIAFNPHEIDTAAVTQMLQCAPEFVDRNPMLVGRKSADPIAILTVLASVWLLVSNPFSKKFLERLGEKSADAAIAFLSWLKNEVLATFARIDSNNPLFELQMPYKGCVVEFFVASREPEILVKATHSVHEAAQHSLNLVDRLEHLGVQKLVYAYDPATQRWLPLYAATRMGGVISDRRALIVLDQFRQSQ